MLANYRGHFHLAERIAKLRNSTSPIQTGGLWFALPGAYDDALVSLFDPEQMPERLVCHGRVQEGRWLPVQEHFPAPNPIKLYLRWNGNELLEPGLGSRPGIVLGEPFSNRPGSRALFSIKRALWAPGQSAPLFQYGSLGVLGPSHHEGWYRLWQVWGIDVDNEADKNELLMPAPDGDLGRCRTPKGLRAGSLTRKAQRLAAEMLGARPWTGFPSPPPPDPSNPEIPFQWELVKVRLGASKEWTPCLVVSPDVLNGRNDLVVLRCVPYDSADDEEEIDDTFSAIVPLPSSFQFREMPWSVALPLVRGIPFASEYWESFGISTKDRIDLRKLDKRAADRVYLNLRSLYA